MQNPITWASNGYTATIWAIKTWYWGKVLRKAKWIVEVGLKSHHVSRADRRRYIRDVGAAVMAANPKSDIDKDTEASRDEMKAELGTIKIKKKETPGAPSN
jgi:hypothetical protein